MEEVDWAMQHGDGRKLQHTIVSSHWLQCFTFSGPKEVEDHLVQVLQEPDRFFAKKI